MAPVFIVTIVIAASLIFVKMILDYNQAKMVNEHTSEPERSLPASELTKLIRESVAEEIRPLTEKIDRLEKQADEDLPAVDPEGDVDPEGKIDLDVHIESGEEANRASRPARER